jgi:predicted O-methyltransferase YrrM
MVDARSQVFAQSWAAEDTPLLTARNRSQEMGTVPVSPDAGAALAVIAAAIAARSVVEIGTGCGVSGLWLLRGMSGDGVLTSIDREAEHQRLARLAYSAAGIRPGRIRLICGEAVDVLPRLTDASYDLVVIDADHADAQAHLVEALRLLRPGGTLAVNGALAGDSVADPSDSSAEAVGARKLLDAIREQPLLFPVLLPVGSGLLVAVVRPEES